MSELWQANKDYPKNEDKLKDTDNHKNEDRMNPKIKTILKIKPTQKKCRQPLTRPTPKQDFIVESVEFGMSFD